MSMDMRSLKLAFKRALHYYRQGYGLASIPFAVAGYASSIYFLAIQNIPFLLRLFPTFRDFVVVGIMTLPIFCVAVGYFYVKRSTMYTESIEVGVEANPYNWVKVGPMTAVLWEKLIELFEKEGMDTQLMTKILENSRLDELKRLHNMTEEEIR